jgi:hypothetical protein
MKIKVNLKCVGADQQVQENCNETIARKLLDKWFEWDEYIEIELDTEDLSARVVEQ